MLLDYRLNKGEDRSDVEAPIGFFLIADRSGKVSLTKERA
jgi:hypothetical protein